MNEMNEEVNKLRK